MPNCAQFIKTDITRFALTQCHERLPANRPKAKKAALPSATFTPNRKTLYEKMSGIALRQFGSPKIRAKRFAYPFDPSTSSGFENKLRVYNKLRI